MDNYNLISGRDFQIGENCLFNEISEKNINYVFGDYCKVYENCRFFMSNNFEMGDYGIIRANAVFHGYEECKIGHNAWIGQNAIINSTDKLKIGNNMGIGDYSKIWTHAYHGELLLGCRIAVGLPWNDFKGTSGEVVIGDDFWGIGEITISPGVKIGNKVIALTHSLITKDVPDNTIVAGIPAKPISINNDFRGYVDLNENEKYQLMKNFAKEFVSQKNIKSEFDDKNRTIKLGNNEIEINCKGKDYDDGITYFDIIKRTYTKKHNKLEREFMKFVLGHRARFLPE